MGPGWLGGGSGEGSGQGSGQAGSLPGSRPQELRSTQPREQLLQLSNPLPLQRQLSPQALRLLECTSARLQPDIFNHA